MGEDQIFLLGALTLKLLKQLGCSTPSALRIEIILINEARARAFPSMLDARGKAFVERAPGNRLRMEPMQRCRELDDCCGSLLRSDLRSAAARQRSREETAMEALRHDGNNLSDWHAVDQPAQAFGLGTHFGTPVTRGALQEQRWTAFAREAPHSGARLADAHALEAVADNERLDRSGQIKIAHANPWAMLPPRTPVHTMATRTRLRLNFTRSTFGLTDWRSAAVAKRPSVCIALLGGTGEYGTTLGRRKRLAS